MSGRARNEAPATWILDVHVYGGLLLASIGAGLFHVGAGLLVAGIGLAAIARWG